MGIRDIQVIDEDVFKGSKKSLLFEKNFNIRDNFLNLKTTEILPISINPDGILVSISENIRTESEVIINS